MPTTQLDVAWVLIAASLVLFMQAGFLCLECGLVRAKNSINVAIKNVVDFLIAGLLFYLFAFGMIFGPTFAGLVGLSPPFFSASSPASISFFLFQLAFCGAATTIVSGAVAERMRFGAYITVAALVSGLIYPVFAHWAWGGLGASSGGWLKAIGFVDFAGSTVVHAIGGWVALAALILIGPRLGRFGPNGQPIEPSNLPVAALGVFILLLGWIGFNGGSRLELSDKVPIIILNTILAAISGGLATLLLVVHRKGHPDAAALLNGVLAGLVAVTASCDAIAPPAALAIGAIGGVVAHAVAEALERLEIDDAIGAVPVHLGAGLWGTLAVALFADPALLPAGDRLSQLGVQAVGSAAAGALGFGVTWIVLSTLRPVLPLRVAAEDERIGLNVSEHRASTALFELVSGMQRQSESGNFREAVTVEPHTEAGVIAVYYNRVLERFNEVNGSLEAAMRELRDAELQARRHLQRISDEVQAARDIQLGLVPTSFPPPTATRPVKLAGFMEPARVVGGDFFDCFFGLGHVWVVIGDVADKGMAAALFMARCKSAVRLAANVSASYGRLPDPAGLMQTVNAEMCQGNPMMMFVTLFLARIDLSDGTMVYCNAGHADPLLCGSDGSVRHLGSNPQAPIGIRSSAPYGQQQTRLRRDDMLVLYTDGVTEARDADDTLFGDERLVDHLRQRALDEPAAVSNSTRDAILSFSSGRDLADDVTLLALRFLGPSDTKVS